MTYQKNNNYAIFWYGSRVEPWGNITVDMANRECAKAHENRFDMTSPVTDWTDMTNKLQFNYLPSLINLYELQSSQ